MSKLTVGEAAFSGFGLVKRDPQTFLGAAVLMSALGVLTALVLVPAYARMFTAMLDAASADVDPTASLEATLGFYASLGPLMLLSIPIGAMVLAALDRSLVFGRSEGWVLGLKIGMDELRVILVTIVGYILSYLAFLVVGILALVAAGVAAAGVAAGGGGDGGAAAVMLLLIIPLYFGAAAVSVWIGIRLCLAGPATIGESRFVIFESWSMTKGRFWKLFLGYLVVYVLSYLIYLAVWAVAAAVAFGSLMSTSGGEMPDFSGLESMSLNPMVVVGGILYGVVVTFIASGFLGVAAAGYRDWKAASPAGAAEVF